MAELSPAAQAVLDAAAEAMECPDNFLPYERDLMAAALRAAADQVLPPPQKHWPHYELGVARDRLLGIADELEAQL